MLGQPLNRIEGRSKVTGAARYAADTRLPGMVQAVGVMSTIASGEIVAVETAAAETSPGVLRVFHAGNAPKLGRCPEDVSVGERRPPFEDDRIYYAGQFVALVVAGTFEQARRAAQLVRVVYREAPFALTLAAGQAAHGLDADDSDNDQSRGEPMAAFARAAVKLDATYTTPVEVHNAMEMHAAVAAWDGDRLVVHDSTQWVVGQARALACTFGIPEDHVTVHSPYIGGGFGAKLFLWPHTTLAAMAARELKRPVKLSLDRRSQFTSAGHRPVTQQRVRIGATTDGQLVALQHDSLSHTSLVHPYLESCADISRSLYRCANVGTSQRRVPVNVGTPTPMRGPGETPGLWALESALDELAVMLKKDPLELRLRNLAERDEGKDLPWSAATHRECLELAARRFGWSRRNPAVGSMRAGEEVLGWGIASASWPGHRDEARVRVRLQRAGTVRVESATQDIGTGTYTVMAQVVSELTGLPFDRIEVVIGDSTLPEGPISGGSLATASLVPALAEATRRALRALTEVRPARRPGATVAPPLEADVIRELLDYAGIEEVVGEAHTDEGDGSEHHSIRSFGAHCVEVRWQPEIARARVSRVVSVIDAGRIINRKTAANQVYGSIVMGLGMALLEESVYDERSGRVVTDNLADYLIPVHADMPEIDLTLLDRPDPHIGEFGARGIGEIGLTGVAPAIAAAIYHATGRRIRELPISVDKLDG